MPFKCVNRHNTVCLGYRLAQKNFTIFHRSWPAMPYLIKCNHLLTSISVWYKNANILLQLSKYVIFMKLLSEWSAPGAWVSNVKCIRLIAYFIMRQSGKICSSVNDVYSSAKPQNCRTDRVLRIKSSKLRPVNLFLFFFFLQMERDWEMSVEILPLLHPSFSHILPSFSPSQNPNQSVLSFCWVETSNVCLFQSLYSALSISYVSSQFNRFLLINPRQWMNVQLKSFSRHWSDHVLNAICPAR